MTRESMLRLPSGVVLHCVESGPRDGIPVVMLHGITDSWHSFAQVLPYLPQSIRAVAISQRGHGDSSRPESGYAPSDFAADIAHVLGALQLRSAFLVGHSMGATHALRFATTWPWRTRGLLLLGAFASFADNPAVTGFMGTAVEPLVDPVPRALVREFQESTLAGPIDPAFLERVVDESLKLPARVWRAAFQGLLAEDVLADVGRVAMPVRLVWGGADVFCRELDHLRLAAAIPQATLRVIAGAGHAPHWEDPAAIADEVAGFVDAVAAAA